MTFELRFKEEALAEWRRLDGSLREQFKKKLAERMQGPRLPSAKLSGHPDRYKIKLRGAGYRLVYEVRDREMVVVVIAVGRRDRNSVYRVAAGRA
jgi:mRNA interferase RelE/StbE